MQNSARGSSPLIWYIYNLGDRDLFLISLINIIFLFSIFISILFLHWKQCESCGGCRTPNASPRWVVMAVALAKFWSGVTFTWQENWIASRIPETPVCLWHSLSVSYLTVTTVGRMTMPTFMFWEGCSSFNPNFYIPKIPGYRLLGWIIKYYSPKKLYFIIHPRSLYPGIITLWWKRWNQKKITDFL